MHNYFHQRHLKFEFSSNGLAETTFIRCVKPRPHQQQCPSNTVERYKLNDSFDSVECCFDIVAVFGNNVANFGNNVKRNFET